MTPPNSEQDRSKGRERAQWYLSRRAVLITGTIASGTLALGEATGQAAARRGGKARYSEGMRVVDAEDPDPDPAIILEILDVPISDWIVYGTETVADQNPAYDSKDRVVIIAFERLLEQGWPDWRQTPPNRLFDGVVTRGIKFHAFPRRRLERTRPTG